MRCLVGLWISISSFGLLACGDGTSSDEAGMGETGIRICPAYQVYGRLRPGFEDCGELSFQATMEERQAQRACIALAASESRDWQASTEAGLDGPVTTTYWLGSGEQSWRLAESSAHECLPLVFSNGAVPYCQNPLAVYACDLEDMYGVIPPG